MNPRLMVKYYPTLDNAPHSAASRLLVKFINFDATKLLFAH